MSQILHQAQRAIYRPVGDIWSKTTGLSPRNSETPQVDLGGPRPTQWNISHQTSAASLYNAKYFTLHKYEAYWFHFRDRKQHVTFQFFKQYFFLLTCKMGTGKGCRSVENLVAWKSFTRSSRNSVWGSHLQTSKFQSHSKKHRLNGFIIRRWDLKNYRFTTKFNRNNAKVQVVPILLL